jgi:DNA-binding MarR family transcriptional regulator
VSLADSVHAKPGHLIRRAQQIAVALFLERLAPLALTPVQYAALAAIEAEPGVEQIRAAGLLALDRSTAGRVVLALETRGLLKREPDAADRRVKRLALTPAGRALLRRARPLVELVQQDILAPLSAAERRAFLAALAKLTRANNDASRAPLAAE